MEVKGVTVTLFRTSESNGNPLTVSFPSDKSKHLSRLSDRSNLTSELAGSFGGAIMERNRVKTEQE